jgi:hypothetical protein
MDPATIRAPAPYHIYWPALRTRRFVQKFLGEKYKRGTYDKNIRILNAVYGYMVGTDADAKLFMQRVNPILFAKMLGWSELETRRLIGGRAYHELWLRVANSKCACCRALA